MSYRLVTAAWSVPLPATAKLVLVRLADFADDDGACWPGLGRIAADTGLCERAVRYAILAIERAGFLSREAHGSRGTVYTLKLATGAGLDHAIPAPDAAITDTETENNRHVMPLKPASGATKPASGAETVASGAKLPAPHATKQSRTTNEPVIESTKNRSAPRSPKLNLGVPVPDWVPRKAWDDFVQSRKKLRKPMTDEAMHLTIVELEKLRRLGVDLTAALNTSTQRGWLTVYAPKAAGDGQSAGTGAPYKPIAVSV